MSHLVPLSKSYEAYKRSFQVILNRSTIRQAIISCIQRGTKRGLEKFTEASFSGENRAFRILGVGSGEGKMDLLKVQIVAEHLGSNKNKLTIDNVIVEPSSVLLQEFKKSTFSLPPSLAHMAKVTFDWRQTAFQDYIQESMSPDDKNKTLQDSFDYIHFVHSIYYMDAGVTLEWCFENQLRSNGVIFCLVQSQESFIVKLSKAMNIHCGDVTFYTDVDLENIAKRNNWLYTVIKQQYVVDVTICFEGPSEEGDLLIDFLSHHRNFRVTAGTHLTKAFNEHLSALVNEDNGGKKYVKGEMAAVLIFK